MKVRPIHTLFILLAALASLGSTAARGPEPGGLTLTAGTAGVHLRWAPGSAVLQSSQPPAPQLIALELPDGADPAPQAVATSRPWGGAPPTPAPLPTRTLPDGSVFPPLPGFGPAPAPDTPLALLREGRMRGRRIVVYALSPVYRDGDGAALLTSLSADIPLARPLGSADTQLSQAPARMLLGAAPGPDPIAARSAWTIRVEQAGIQSVSASALQAAGLDLSSIDPSNLRLWRQGVTIPLERRPSSGPPSELRFYAPPPGDRYNSADTYWLTVEATATPIMVAADAQPSGSPACESAALARGTWRAPALYDSRLPGPDGDHYFAAELKTAPAPDSPASAIADLSSTLPRASGAMTLTVAGASLFVSTHTLSVTLAGAAQTTSWAGTGNFTRTLSFAAGASQAGVALMARADVDGVHLDSVAWEAPVQLSFGGQGASFVGPAGQRCFTLSGLPAGADLYDVSDPAAPIHLTNWTSSFEVNATSARDYILAGPGTLHSPPVAAHAPVDLASPLNAQAIYIAPDAFISPLAPLVARRQAQGYSVAVVRAQDIYDAWGGGQASPQAIRAFLRYAAGTWATAPIAVTLVGDGTHDPRNYLGVGQISWIPPYLAPVDPWLGETACENCFVQLDGADPLADPLPDLRLGRLPVKSAAELDQLVAKIIAYESQPGPGPWAGRAIYLADNTDTGGDFAYVANQSAAALPSGVQLTRVYYDPAAPANEPWRVRDSYAAFTRTMAALNGGAAAVSYLGHGLGFQWAYTGPPLSDSVPQDRQYLLNVDFAGDLTNGSQLPVVLSLTCLTGQFQVPSVRGTTIDEALLLNPRGGAIGTWSSAGLGVLYGHDALQRGFLGALWGAQAGSPARLGDLALAGYQELFTAGGCCQEELRVYGLFGDPLTPVRVQKDIHDVLLPIVRR